MAAIAQSIVCLALRAGAADQPVAADSLVVRDASAARGPRLLFAALLEPSLTADPRIVGATFEVVGDGAGEGGTGVVSLHASRWRGLGSPAGSAGYEYRDRAATDGVRRVVLEPEAGGGTRLRVSGASPSSFEIRQAHGPVDVRFAVGGEGWCARATTFGQNGAGRLVARDLPAPSGCGARAVRCGNRVAEAGEGCDDGGIVAGDGCSPSCDLESAAGLCAGVSRSPHDAVGFVRIVGGLSNVTHVTAPPLDPSRLFVVRQTGRVHVLRDGALLPDPFLQLTPDEDISIGGERGLLSLAFHPRYAENGRFFVFYTDTAGALVIARYQVSADPDRADADSRRVLLRRDHPRGNHNGGQLAFGPDGYLYAGFGDGGGSDDPDEAGQSTATMLGKILRIDVDVEERPFHRVPPTNPFRSAGPRLGLIWDLGFRNPWRFSFDRLTSDLYIGDVGQNTREEIDVEPAGSEGGTNYGWDVFEGSVCREPEPLYPSCDAAPEFVAPVFDYAHSADPPDATGCSVTGGFVYRGCRLDGEQGTYFFSDFCTRFVRTFRGVADGRPIDLRDRTAELAPVSFTLGNVTTFGEDARGELYIGDQSGQVFRLAPRD